MKPRWTRRLSRRPRAEKEPPENRLSGTALAAAVTATVTVAITAALTPVGSWLGSGFHAKDSDGSATHPSAVELHRVSDPSGAVSLTIPSSWGHQRGTLDAPYGIKDADHRGRKNYQGAALSVGTADGLATNNAGWVGVYGIAGASAEAAHELGLTGATRSRLQAWADHYIRSQDWTRSGCVLADEAHPDIDGYVTTLRIWEGCSGIDTVRFWDLAGAPESGEALFTVQLNQGDLTTNLIGRVVTSVSIAPERLPAPSSESVDPAVP